MIFNKMATGTAAAALLALGACSGKSDQAGGNASGSTAVPATQEAAIARMPKAGLWKMTVTAAGMPQPMTMRTCFGEPAPGANPFAPPPQPGQNCSKNSIVPTADGYTIDMACTANGMGMAIQGTVSGDFSTRYKTELTTKMSGPNLPPAAQQAVKSSADAEYLGACPADMKVGETKQGA
jgi:hypothetical protein